MSDWSRLYDACKDATGTEIEDIYDAHLVVEELDDKCRKLTKENDLPTCNMQEFMLYYQDSKHDFTDSVVDVLKTYKR